MKGRSNSTQCFAVHFMVGQNALPSALCQSLAENLCPLTFNVLWVRSERNTPDGIADLRGLATRLAHVPSAEHPPKPFMERLDRSQRKWAARNLRRGFVAHLPTVVLFDHMTNGSNYFTSKGTPTKSYRDVMADPNSIFVVQDPLHVSGTLGLVAASTPVDDKECLRAAVESWARMNSTSKRESELALVAFGSRAVTMPGYSAPRSKEIEECLRRVGGYPRPGRDAVHIRNETTAIDCLIREAHYAPRRMMPLVGITREVIASMVALIN